MGWGNYRWAWNVRGVSSSEQLVLLYLADQANGDGEINRLRINSICQKCHNLDRRRVQRILSELTDKAFITARTSRFAPKGNQVSNAYRLNLGRFHPPDKVGAKLWKDARNELQRDGELTAGKLEAYTEHSTAFYENRTLSIWLPSKHACDAIGAELAGMRSRFRDRDPAVSRFDVLPPP